MMRIYLPRRLGSRLHRPQQQQQRSQAQLRAALLWKPVTMPGKGEKFGGRPEISLLSTLAPCAANEFASFEPEHDMLARRGASYSGPSVQEMKLTLHSLNADVMKQHRRDSQCSSSVEALRLRLDAVVVSLENYFGISRVHQSAASTPRPVPGEHMLGDITQLVVASSNLLRLFYLNFNMGSSISGAVQRDALDRVLNMLTVSTLLATDRKGLKFSVSQIAEYVSNFRYVDPVSSQAAQKLIYTLGRRFNQTPFRAPKENIRRKINFDHMKLSSASLGYLLLGFSSMSTGDSNVRKLMKTVTKHIWQMNSIVSARDLSRACYGLKSVSLNCAESRELLSALAKVFQNEDHGDGLRFEEPPRTQMTPREIASALYGLNRLTDQNTAVRQILFVLTSQLDGMIISESGRATFTGREISMCLFGLRNMTFESEASRRLLEKVAHVISIVPPGGTNADDYKLQGLSLANTIHGLKNMRSDTSEVLSLISGVLSRIDSVGSFQFRDISAAYFGLRNMHSDVAEVKLLLRALNKEFLDQDFSGSVDARGIGNMLYGLRYMSDEEPEVRKVLAWLAMRVKGCVAEGLTLSNNRVLAYSFNGLRRMSSNTHEVREILDLLNGQLENHLMMAKPPLQPWEIVLSFNGLRYKSPLYGSEESLLQRTTIILAEALAQVHATELISSSHVCSILTSVNKLSSECSEVAMVLRTLVSSMQEHVEFGMKHVVPSDEFYPIFCVLSGKVDDARAGKLRYSFPSHELMADAIEGMHMLSKTPTAVQLIDLLTVYLLQHPSIYASTYQSTRPARRLHTIRYVDTHFDKYSEVFQNRFTTDQVLKMMVGIQGMHGADIVTDLFFPDSCSQSDENAMVRVVDRMLEYLTEQLFDSPNIILNTLLADSKRALTIKEKSHQLRRGSSKSDFLRNKTAPQNGRSDRTLSASTRSTENLLHDTTGSFYSAIDTSISAVEDEDTDLDVPGSSVVMEPWTASKRGCVLATARSEYDYVEKGNKAPNSEKKSRRFPPRPVLFQKDLRLSPEQLAKLIMSIRRVDCSTGSSGPYSKISLLKFVNEELRNLVNQCPSPEIAYRDAITMKMKKNNAGIGCMKVNNENMYTSYKKLFQRSILSFPYMESLPLEIKMEIFGTIAKLNDKLLLIQEYFSSRKLISEPLVDHRAIQWRQNWVLAARERFNTRQALDQYSAGNIVLSSVEVLENEVLHHFDACIAVRVRLSDCINELELKPCFEKIINVEIEQMIDYIDIEKDGFNQIRDEYLSKYHDITVVRGTLHDIDIDVSARNLDDDEVFSTVHAAICDTIAENNVF